MSRISIKALVCSQNQKSFYVTVMNSEDLRDMCFVSRKCQDPKKGFQRLLNTKRAKAIATYLDNGEGVIPPAIILSAQPLAQICYNPNNYDLTMERQENTLLVLDGQHRLYGLFQAEKKYEIPVVIFHDLNTQEEIRQFIDINTTQKGVSTALLLDIKSQAGTETKIEERQRNLFDRVNKESVLAGYLLQNESKAGKISRTTFNQATKSIFTDGPLAAYSDDMISKAVINYLAAIDSIFKRSESSAAKLTKNILFKAMMSMFNDVCDKCLAIYGNFKLETIEEYLAPLQNLSYDEYTGTNKATETRIIMDIKSELRRTSSIEEDVF